MDTFAFLKIASLLLTPPASLALGAFVALVLAAIGWRRFALFVLVLAIAHILILAFQPVGDVLMGSLERRARLAAAEAQPCCYDAIVVLGGGIAAAHPPQQMDPHLNEGADRIWQAARLYKRGVAPRIIVTGGSFLAQQGETPFTEADAMRVFLMDLGVPSDAITGEDMALNTIENIRNVLAIVGQGRVALVTSAYHMPRAMQIAALVGLKASAFPTDFEVVREARLPWENWLPSVGAMHMSNLALHEIVALNLDFRSLSLRP